MYMGSRIKNHYRYARFYIFLSSTVNYETRIFGVIGGSEKGQDGQISSETVGSSLFDPFKIIRISKKQNAYCRIRTRDDLLEGLEDHHYAIKSSIASQFNWIMYFLSTNEIVIYFTIYENMMLSRRLKIRLNYFFNDFDRK